MQRYGIMYQGNDFQDNRNSYKIIRRRDGTWEVWIGKKGNGWWLAERHKQHEWEVPKWTDATPDVVWGTVFRYVKM